MTAYETILEAAAWAPHRRDQSLEEAIVKRAAEENWDFEELCDALPHMSKEAVFGTILKTVSMPFKATGGAMIRAVPKSPAVKGFKGLANRAGGFVGQQFQKRPFMSSLAALFGGLGASDVASKSMKALGPRRVM